MAKGEVYAQNINTEDLSSFIKKSAIIDSNNDLHSMWRLDKDRMFSKFYFAISLSLAIFTSLFQSWLMFFVLLNSLAILLIMATKKYNEQKRRFEENRKIMKKGFSSWGLEWRD